MSEELSLKNISLHPNLPPVEEGVFASVEWLQVFRAEMLQKFLQRGFPMRKEELWKYTDTRYLMKSPLCHASEGWHPGELSPQQTKAWMPAFAGMTVVFVNGYFSEELSALSQEATLLPLSQAIKTHEKLLKPYLLNQYDEKRFPFAVLNSALMTDGIFLHVEKNKNITAPVHCIFINTQQNDVITSPRNIILADENSQLTIIEEHLGENAENYFVNPVTIIQTKNGANVDYYKIQNESHSATHIANVFINQHQDSKVKTFFFSRGGQLEREDVNVRQEAVGAETHLSGFYSLHHDNQHVDHHVHVDHLAAQGTSTMVYKGILDQKSRAVFNGKVFVHPNAQQINSHQENHNLLLSDNAEINTKPELEIYADDVKCTHGATVGQLDNKSLFYLRSRGIDENAARKMLIHAFSDAVFTQIKNAEIKKYIQQRVGHHDEL